MDSKSFNPEIESVEEFVERFKLQNLEKLSAAASDNIRVMLLANALPIKVLTDLQRCLKPTTLTNATYKQIHEHLISSYGIN